ncbi:MAG TPA: cytochrome c [Chitinophagaceae bacterium]|jgi:cytochrome c551/c552|nr:cytochrome c [Chitinophagaceae bacterium]
MKIKALIIALLVVQAAFAIPPVEEGKTIFTNRCASCHNVNKVMTGPALAGLHERRSIEWIISFVKSSQSLVKAGDKEAVALFEKFNKIPMPDHPDLTDDNIKSIVEYIKSAGSAEGEKAPFATPARQRPNYTPLKTTDYGFFLTYLALVGMLVMGLLFAVRVKELQRQRAGGGEAEA